MSLNGLTSSAGLKLGPLVLETLVKHYFERLKVPATTSSDGIAQDGKQSGSTPNNNLRQEELLYDQAFTIVKVSITRVLSPDSTATLASPDCVARAFLCHLFLAVLRSCPLLIRDLISPSPRCCTQDFLATSSR